MQANWQQFGPLVNHSFSDFMERSWASYLLRIISSLMMEWRAIQYGIQYFYQISDIIYSLPGTMHVFMHVLSSTAQLHNDPSAIITGCSAVPATGATESHPPALRWPSLSYDGSRLQIRRPLETTFLFPFSRLCRSYWVEKTNPLEVLVDICLCFLTFSSFRVHS